MLKMKKYKPKDSLIEYEPYKNCPFCKHKEKPGCFGCKERKAMDEGQAAKEKADLARLEASRIGTFRFDSPAEMETLKNTFSAERLGEFFDSSDIGDDDVLLYLGHGNKQHGESLLRDRSTIAFQFQPLHGNPKSWEEFKVFALEHYRQEMAQERAHKRLTESLQGKPGSAA